MNPAPTNRTKAPRARKKAPPPSMKPWPVGILAIDTARNSGYAIYCDGKYIRSGETKIADHGVLAAIVSQAMGDASDYATWAVVVLVLERPWGGRLHQIIGMGAARQAWESAWKSMGQPKPRIARVYPQSWRARVLGRFAKGGAPAIESRVALLEKCQRAVEIGDRETFEVGSDEAAAICIGKWAAHAGEVGAVLPRKIRESL